MLQMTASTSTDPVTDPVTDPLPDRRAPAPPRNAPPALVVELASAEDFSRLVERQALRCRRDRQGLSVLRLQLQFDSEPDEALRLQLLAECARRLCSRVRASDCVARWQATHFGVLLPRCEPAQAEAVLARLTRFAGGNYRLGERLLHLRVQGHVLGRLDP